MKLSPNQMEIIRMLRRGVKLFQDTDPRRWNRHPTSKLYYFEGSDCRTVCHKSLESLFNHGVIEQKETRVLLTRRGHQLATRFSEYYRFNRRSFNVSEFSE